MDEKIEQIPKSAIRNPQLLGLDKRLEHDIKKLNFFKRIE